VAKRQHFSGYAGTMALSLIAIPVVVRTTDNMLRLVPNSLLEAAFALGAPRWKVAMMVRLRAVKAGVSPACCWPWPASPARPRRCCSPR
jgi:phosphate transport system permease protein